MYIYGELVIYFVLFEGWETKETVDVGRITTRI